MQYLVTSMSVFFCCCCYCCLFCFFLTHLVQYSKITKTGKHLNEQMSWDNTTKQNRYSFLLGNLLDIAVILFNSIILFNQKQLHDGIKQLVHNHFTNKTEEKKKIQNTLEMSSTNMPTPTLSFKLLRHHVNQLLVIGAVHSAGGDGEIW